jgi:hypothetical protein
MMLSFEIATTLSVTLDFTQRACAFSMQRGDTMGKIMRHLWYMPLFYGSVSAGLQQ